MSAPSTSANAATASSSTPNPDGIMTAAIAPPQVTPNVTGGSVFKSNNPFARPLSNTASHSPATAPEAAASASQTDPFQLAELQATLPGSSSAGAGAGAGVNPFAETDQSKAGQEVEQADDSDDERPSSPRPSASGTAAATRISEAHPTATGANDMDMDYAPPDHPPPETAAVASPSTPQSPSYAPPPHPPPEHARTTSSSSHTYAPPSHPPLPEVHSAEHGRQPSGLPLGYHPTTVATPGQPLLANGRILLYPLSDPVCPKCRGTGYQRADILNPCRKCWDKYGRPMRKIETGELDPRQFALQAPLPSLSHSHASSMPGSPSVASSPPRRGPPQVGRSAEADEELADENGEVPPSYDDSIRTSEPLPPRRAGEPDTTSTLPPHIAHTAPGAAGRLPFAPPLVSLTSGHYAGGGGYPGAQHRPPHHHPQQQHHQQGLYHGGWNQHAPYPQHGQHHGGGSGMPFVAPIPHGRRPPPGALVLPPGDPRLGGQLCLKCGGDGETESFWLGSETCSRCRGVGRIF